VLPSTCVSKEIRWRPSRPFLCGAHYDFSCIKLASSRTLETVCRSWN
jgi:hypothetical protein